MTAHDVSGSALPVTLYDVSVNNSNEIRIWLEFEDGLHAALEFAPGSDESNRILELCSELATERLSALGQTGVVFTGFTPSENGE